MNLKQTFFAAAAVAATVTVGTVAVSPAQAASISPGSTINLSSPGVTGGGVTLSGNALNFFSLTNPLNNAISGQGIGVDGGNTGSFLNANIASVLVSPLPSIKDLALTGSAPTLTFNGLISNFISGLDLSLGGLRTTPVFFDLTQFIYNTGNGDATVAGIFRTSTSSIAATGLFTSQLPGVTRSSYSLSLTAVPTPALLPGLLALGAGVLRKRKQQAVEVETEA
ncbi:PTPA-CTERM sorting domain-containing protein [Phormidesmis sp. 146-33]